jgi:uncharacterized membrane protein YeaQ/YmgE (transglycosylase-associated protein family)
VLVVNHFVIRAPFVISHLSFVVSLAWLLIGNFGIAGWFPNRKVRKNMLHLIWYVFVGFLVGCVAKALMHSHLSITWTVVLGIVGSIIGGAVTHLFYPPGAGGKFHLGGLIVSIIGAILVLYIWHKFRLQLPRG